MHLNYNEFVVGKTHVGITAKTQHAKEIIGNSYICSIYSFISSRRHMKVLHSLGNHWLHKFVFVCKIRNLSNEALCVEDNQHVCGMNQIHLNKICKEDENY